MNIANVNEQLQVGVEYIPSILSGFQGEPGPNNNEFGLGLARGGRLVAWLRSRTAAPLTVQARMIQKSFGNHRRSR